MFWSSSNRASTLKVLTPREERGLLHGRKLRPGVCQKMLGEPTCSQMSYIGAWIYESVKALAHVPPQTLSPETIKRSKYIRIRGMAF